MINILIFGTGSAVYSYIKSNEECFENNIKVLAFIDNNTQKQGKKFIGKEIISPNCIFKYDYDAILIASVYEEEIQRQLISEIKICKQKIYTRRNFFEQIIFPWYNKKYDLYNKRILIISEDNGTDKEYKKYYGRFYDIFFIVGTISLNHIDEMGNYIYDYILLTDFSPSYVQKNLKKRDIIINNFIHDKNKILTTEILGVYFNNIKKSTYYEKYNENKYLIIRINRYFMGFGSMVLMVAKGIAYAKKIGYIPVVDMKTVQTQYIEDGEYGKINAYTKFFKQQDVYDIDDIRDSKHISIMYNSMDWCSKKDMRELVFPEMQDELFYDYCKFKKRFDNKKILGVLFRGTDYANLKPYGHNIQPDLNTMISMVKKKILEWGDFDLIYLCTEVYEACKYFEEEFGKEKVFYYPQLRYKSNTKKCLAKVNLAEGERTKQGKDYWIALNCLALCHSIIAGQTTGTVIALMINNYKYKHSYLFELGKYGIDDVK